MRRTDVLKTGCILRRDFLVVTEKTGVFFVFRKSGAPPSTFAALSHQGALSSVAV